MFSVPLREFSSSDTANESGTYWHQAGQTLASYFSTERIKAFGGVALACGDAASSLIEISAATGVGTPVGALAAVAAVFEVANCITFGTASVLSSQSNLTGLSDASDYANPFGLSFAATGAVIGGQSGEQFGLDIGGMVDSLRGMNADIEKLLSGSSGSTLSTAFTVGSLLGNDYSVNTNIEDLLAALSASNSAADDNHDSGSTEDGNDDVGDIDMPGQGDSNPGDYGVNTDTGRGDGGDGNVDEGGGDDGEGDDGGGGDGGDGGGGDDGGGDAGGGDDAF